MLTDQSSKKVYNIAGVTTPIATGYEIPFTIFQSSDVVVSIGNEDGTVAAITEGWSVSMAESDTSVNKVIFDSGYSFPDGSTTLTISRDVPAEQDLDLRNGDDMDAEDIEEALDKLTAQIQQLNEVTGRAFKLPISENPGDMNFPSSSARASKIIGFDQTGKDIVMYSNPDDAIQQANDANEQSQTILTQVQQTFQDMQALVAQAEQILVQMQGMMHPGYRQKLEDALARKKALEAEIAELDWHVRQLEKADGGFKDCPGSLCRECSFKDGCSFALS